MRHLIALVCVIIPCVIFLCLLISNYCLNNQNDRTENFTEETSEILFNFRIEGTEFGSGAKKIRGKGESPKKVIPKHYVPKFMLDLYESSKNEYRNALGRPEIVKSVIPTNTGTTGFNFNENHRIIFEIPTHDDDEQFLEAELRILTITENYDFIKLPEESEKLLKISIYDFQSNALQYVQEKRIFHKNNTWISFNLTKTVEKIVHEDNPRKSVSQNFEGALEVNIDVINMQISLSPNPENVEHEYPILLLSYSTKTDDAVQHLDKKQSFAAKNENSLARIKRTILEEDYEEETNKIWVEEVPSEPTTLKGVAKKFRRMRNLCRRKSMYVDFAEINYDNWIVQPTGYEAYQCAGKCFYPVAAHLSPTKHAIVQALLHSVAPSRAPRSCCVPTRLDSISVLYVDGRGILTYRYGYKDMVVAECGCR